jgi:membrane-associated phospholipid phosphatase
MVERFFIHGCYDAKNIMSKHSRRRHISSVQWMVVVAVISITATNRAIAQSTNPPDPPAAPSEQPKEVHPEPEHTGWATLARDAGRDFVSFPKRPSTWVFLAVGAAGALAAHPGDDYVERHIVGNSTANNAFKLGKIVGSAPFEVGAAVGLWVVGRYIVPPGPDGSRTNKASHLGFDLIRAQIVTQAVVQGMKIAVRRDRPTGECCAFPSGHAASAFAAASVLERHLGYRGTWPALVGATYVATSRLVDNRHFLSDVVFGSAVGIASGWTVVGRHGRNEYALQPVPVRGGMMIALARVGND